MADYKITFRKRASKEYLETIAYYQKRSLQTAENFILTIQNSFDLIIRSPYSFRNSYKNFYEIKTKKFPFSIVYLIDDSKGFIIITTIFHNKRNPLKKYR